MARHLAVGDIHGCSKAFDRLLEWVEPRDDDVVITLGDYCNRGPDSRSVLDQLIQLNAKGILRPLRGNHDIMMLRAREGEAEFQKWINVGGDATLKSYKSPSGEVGSLSDIPEKHWEFLETALLPFYETANHFFVHANAYPEIALAEQPDYMLYWESFNDPPKHESGKTMVCGHSSQKSGLPKTNGHAICIDTWACGSGWLTCLDVDSGMMWQSNEQGETRQLWLDEL